MRLGVRLYRRMTYSNMDSMHNIHSLSIYAMCTQYIIHTGSNVYTVYTCCMIVNMHTMGIVIPPFDLLAVPGRLQLQGGISASAIAFDKGVPSWWCLPPPARGGACSSVCAAVRGGVRLCVYGGVHHAGGGAGAGVLGGVYAPLRSVGVYASGSRRVPGVRSWAAGVRSRVHTRTGEGGSLPQAPGVFPNSSGVLVRYQPGRAEEVTGNGADKALAPCPGGVSVYT